MLYRSEHPGIKELSQVVLVVIASVGLYAFALLLPYQDIVRSSYARFVKNYNPQFSVLQLENILATIVYASIILSLILLTILVIDSQRNRAHPFRHILDILSGIIHIPHKGREKIKFQRKKQTFHSINERTKNRATQSITKNHHDYHIEKRDMIPVVEKAINSVMKKTRSFSIKEVMHEIEKSHPLSSFERRYWIDVVKEVIRLNKQYAKHKI